MTAAPAESLARHRRIVLVALPAVVAALALAEPPRAWQLAALAPLVALLGVPHGALDHRLAGLLWPLGTPRQHLAFLAGYLGSAAAVLVLWIAAPAAALALFLGYSALHFSDDWRGELPFAGRALAGLAIVAAPAAAHGPEVAAIFSGLAPPGGAAAVASALGRAGEAALPALALLVAIETRRRPALALELASIAAAALLLPPLAYFAVYFCGVHSPRHLLSASAALGLGPARGALAALPITLVTLAGAAVAAAVLSARGAAADAVTLKAVFIGLAALTVPHMILVDRVWQRTGRSARAS